MVTDAEPLVFVTEPDFITDLGRGIRGHQVPRVGRIEVERMVRSAKGDARSVYILCLEHPSSCTMI
jgi:hypothetical protein